MPDTNLKSRLVPAIELGIRIAFGLLALWALWSGSLVGALIAGLGAMLARKEARDKFLPGQCDDVTARGLAVAGTVVLGLSIGFGMYSRVQEDAKMAELAKAQAILDGQAAETRAKAQTKQMGENALAARQQAQRNSAFLTAKQEVLASFRTSLAAGDLVGANKSIEGLSVTDPELDAVRLKLEGAELREKLKDESRFKPGELESMYARLVMLEPANTAAAKKHDKILAQITKQNVQDAVDQAITQQIATQFSSWDGSHRQVERAIKEGMNDPDSYKHVKTGYERQAKGLLVRTTFRGKNSFGGIITTVAIAKTDPAGNVVALRFER